MNLIPEVKFENWHKVVLKKGNDKQFLSIKFSPWIFRSFALSGLRGAEFQESYAIDQMRTAGERVVHLIFNVYL